MPKRLRILAGPNGSGKSSVYRSLNQNKDFHWGIFDNSESKYRWVAEYDGATGELTFKNDEIPNWVAQYALGK